MFAILMPNNYFPEFQKRRGDADRQGMFPGHFFPHEDVRSYGISKIPPHPA